MWVPELPPHGGVQVIVRIQVFADDGTLLGKSEIKVPSQEVAK